MVSLLHFKWGTSKSERTLNGERLKVIEQISSEPVHIIRPTRYRFTDQD